MFGLTNRMNSVRCILVCCGGTDRHSIKSLPLKFKPKATDDSWKHHKVNGPVDLSAKLPSIERQGGIDTLFRPPTKLSVMSLPYFKVVQT